MSSPFAHLGPALPAEADDLPPVRIIALDVMGVLTGLGEALVRMTVVANGGTTGGTTGPIRLSISVNPRTYDVVRVAARIFDGSSMPCAPGDLPGMILDLARSATQRAFPPLV